MLTIVTGQADANDVDLVEPRTSVGTHSSNAVVIQSASVSEFHAEFHISGDAVYLIDLGSDSGTTVNGKTFSGRVAVKHNDVVTVGDVELTLVNQKLADNASPKATLIRSVASGWMLIGKPDSLMPGETPIEGLMVLGRDKECEICIPLDHLSRLHASLEIVDGNLKLKDLGSANGTSVNGERIKETLLQSGDTVSFDKEEFLVQGPAAVEEVDDKKTKIRAAVSDVKATMANPATLNKPEIEKPAEVEQKRPVDEKPATDGFKSISGGDTDIGKAWKASDVKSANKTEMMPSAKKEGAGTQVMPGVSLEQVPELVCKSEPLSGKQFSLMNTINTIGRARNNDIDINEASVSSRHAEIVNENGTWLIRDLESFNGVYVNKKKFEKKILKNGDVINLGRMRFVFTSHAKGDKRFPSVKFSVLPVKAIAAVTALIAVSVLVYMYVPGLLSGGGKVNLSWQYVSSGQANPSSPVVFDINYDGADDAIITSEGGLVEIIDGNKGFKLSQIDAGASSHSSPLLIDVASDKQMDIVTVAENGEVRAYDINSKLLWANTDIRNQSLVVQAVTAKINGDNVEDIVIPSENSGVVFLDGNTGEILAQTKGLKGKIIARPLVADINRDGITDIVVITDQHQVAAFSVKDTQVHQMWLQNIPPVLTAAAKFSVIQGIGVIYIATQSNGLLARNAQTGGKIWQSQIDGLLFAEPVTTDTDGDKVDDVVVQATYTGNVVAFSASTGDLLWDTQLPNKIQATPLVIQNNAGESDDLLVTDTEGAIHIVNAANGSVSYSAKIENADHFVVPASIGQPGLNGARTLILASQNGNLFSYSIAGNQ